MKERTTLTFDIETTPTVDPDVIAQITAEIQPPGNISKAETLAAWHADKKPALIHEAILKTALDGTRGHIATIAFAIGDENPEVFFVDSTEPHKHEAKLLAAFFEYVESAYQPSMDRLPVWVGHNIINFDLRFLFQRAVILGIKPPLIIPFHAKEWDDCIHDNMVKWTGSKRDYIKQDVLSRALGQEGKKGMDGSMVWPAVMAGKITDVADYNADDVIQARANYKKMNFITD